MTDTEPAPPTIDAYTRENRTALVVFADSGHSQWHGVSRRTLRALGRRGLVWWTERWTGGLTEKGNAVLAALEAEDDARRA